jgi:hypothetical protein
VISVALAVVIALSVGSTIEYHEDLIIVKREGRLRGNYINPFSIEELHDRWIGRYANRAFDLLARMKREIEGY